MSLQERINELLDGKPGIKKADLARHCGIARATVTDWCNGKTKKIEGDTAYKVASFFGNIEPLWVQTGEGKKHKPEKIVTDPMHSRVLAAITLVKKMSDSYPEKLTEEEVAKAYRFATDYATGSKCTPQQIEDYIAKILPLIK